MREEWRIVFDNYEVSNLGNVRSLDRVGSDGRILKGRDKKMSLDHYGYLVTGMTIKGISKQKKVHQLVAKAFLNHKPCGYELVVNHIDFDKTNNSLDNLEIVTNRENTNQKHLKSTSIYTGVCWYKTYNKWISNIRINGKKKHLGYFTNELDASIAYQTELNKQNSTKKVN